MQSMQYSANLLNRNGKKGKNLRNDLPPKAPCDLISNLGPGFASTLFQAEKKQAVCNGLLIQLLKS